MPTTDYLRFFQAKKDMAEVKALCQKFGKLVELMKKSPDSARMGVDGAISVKAKLESLKADGQLLLRIINAQIREYAATPTERRTNDTYAFGRASNVIGELRPVRDSIEKMIRDIDLWLIVENSRSKTGERVDQAVTLVADTSKMMKDLQQQGQLDASAFLTVVMSLTVLIARILKKK
jgi:hypothetical protein